MSRNSFRAAAAALAMMCLLSACGEPGGSGSTALASTPGATTPPVTPAAKSAKRGVAYDMADPLDFAALSPGVSWWYNWASQPNKTVPAHYAARYGMDYESRADVFRYAWFTGRTNNDVHFTGLLGTPGQLTDLGKLYLSLPY